MLHGPKWVSRLGVPGKGKGKCKGKGKGKGKSKGKGQGTKQGARQPSEARAYGRHAVLKGVTQVGKNLQGSTSTCGAVGRAGGDCERDGQDVPICVCVCVSGPVVSLCVCVVCVCVVWCVCVYVLLLVVGGGRRTCGVVVEPAHPGRDGRVMPQAVVMQKGCPSEGRQGGSG